MLAVSGEEINIKRSSGASDDSGPEVRRCGTGTNTEYTGAPFAGGTDTTWYALAAWSVRTTMWMHAEGKGVGSIQPVLRRRQSRPKYFWPKGHLDHLNFGPPHHGEGRDTPLPVWPACLRTPEPLTRLLQTSSLSIPEDYYCYSSY